ncbi:unnamed protein product [Blepharisma stoltei]|uniref:Uncharacterized protein n=1 Tax=Blepharisma stoltei TaxID=1481888 RepID=A0AAU9IJI9_9CILI|nr:unnamed protein product [Blepharisma stoltei]
MLSLVEISVHLILNREIGIYNWQGETIKTNSSEKHLNLYLNFCHALIKTFSYLSKISKNYYLLLASIIYWTFNEI